MLIIQGVQAILHNIVHSLLHSLALQSGSSSASDSEGDDNEEEQEQEKVKKPSKVQIVKNKDTKLKNRYSDYIITPDHYFMMHSSKKVISV